MDPLEEHNHPNPDQTYVLGTCHKLVVSCLGTFELDLKQLHSPPETSSSRTRPPKRQEGEENVKKVKEELEI